MPYESLSRRTHNASARYRSRLDRLVDLANRLELLVILEAEAQGARSDALPAFRRNIAACFRDRPNVFFAAKSRRFADVIRQSGARQPVIITDSVSPRNAGGDLIYQVTPRYAAQQSRHFGMAEVPMLADGLDPELDRASGECAAFPIDPAQASDLIESILTAFDEQNIRGLYPLSHRESSSRIVAISLAQSSIPDGPAAGPKTERRELA